MICVICLKHSALDGDNICQHCFEKMADDMMYEYYEEFNPPPKGKCNVCGIPTLYTTCCVACLDSGFIPF